jgi:hypothetical protein
MPEQEQCDNKIAYKHTGHPPAHCHGTQTRPRAAPRSQLRRQCVTNLPQYRGLRSGEARLPYSVRSLQKSRGGKTPHTACSVPALQIFQQQMS